MNTADVTNNNKKNYSTSYETVISEKLTDLLGEELPRIVGQRWFMTGHKKYTQNFSGIHEGKRLLTRIVNLKQILPESVGRIRTA
jgi:hypothetical protein